MKQELNLLRSNFLGMVELKLLPYKGNILQLKE